VSVILLIFFSTCFEQIGNFVFTLLHLCGLMVYCIDNVWFFLSHLCIYSSCGIYIVALYHDGSYLSSTSGYRTPIRIFYKHCLMIMNSLVFANLGRSVFLLWFWRIALLGIVILSGSYFPSGHEKHHPFTFWPIGFPMWNLLFIY
jgi:hypothetical protein